MRLDRHGAVSAILAAMPSEAAALFPTGYISREAFSVCDRPLNLYLVGSMGHVLSVGLGVALSQRNRAVVIVDGDGGALMGLSAFAMLGAVRPANVVHVVIDDRAYSSTGGQPTLSRDGLLPKIAAAAGYPHVCTIDDGVALQNCIRSSIRAVKGPVFVHAQVSADAREPRARIRSPESLATRFRTEMSSQRCP